jgi:DNA-binding transcriptional LysR family regulator
MMQNIGDIRLFVEAANLGVISAAGRKLGLSPAAASARLNNLETQLKSRLFERTTRSLRLTDEGKAFLLYCQQGLQALDDGFAFLENRTQAVSGRIRISATSDFGRHMLTGWLDEFNAIYPDVQFTLLLSDSLSSLHREDIDLAIRFGEPQDSLFIARKLAKNRRVLCASPDYLKRFGYPQSPEELVRFPCIVLSSNNGPIIDWRFTSAEEVESVRVSMDNARETNDGAVARQWAMDGHGIALKSIWDVAKDIHEKRLEIVLPEWTSAEVPAHALYHRNRYMPARVRAFLDFLLKRFDEESQRLLPI